MSASREKKTRQDVTDQGPTAQEQRKQQEAKANRRNNLLYATIGIICAAAAIFLVIWNTGLIQRNATAITIHGTKHSVADMQYYFNTTRQSMLNYYYNNLGMLPFDHQSSTKSQIYNATTGQTWYEFLMEQAEESMSANIALVEQAKADGYTLSADGQETLDSILTNLNDAWTESSYKEQDDYIKATYGPYMTNDRLLELINIDVLANDYATATADTFEYSNADYQAYYEENADALDSYTFSQLSLRATVATTDAEGNAIEMTDEEKAAALETSKLEVKAVADEILAKLEAGAQPEALAEEYADQLSGSAALSRTQTGSALSSATYSDWFYDTGRQAGDATISEYDASSSGSYYYYILSFEGRARDDQRTASVRHILVAAETDEGALEPTEAQYAAARTVANELLTQWKADGATEEAFSALAMENSADSGSAANGGLISNISATSGYVPTFSDWSLTPGRRAGDTGIVQNTGSSVKGWHIMYYVDSSDPQWQQTADSSLRTTEYSAWETSIAESYQGTPGFGMKFIQG